MEFDYRTSTVLGETETLRRCKQKFVCTRTQGKGVVTPEETEQDLPVSVRGSPTEAWDGIGLPQGQGHCQQQPWEMIAGISPFGGCQ